MYSFSGSNTKDPYNYSTSGTSAYEKQGAGFAGLGKSKAVSKGGLSGCLNNLQYQSQTVPLTDKKYEKSSSSKPSKKSGSDYVPKRFGLKYDPPTIILEYLQPNSGKLYHHKMKLTKLKQETSNQDCIDFLKKKHQTYFMGGGISDDQIISLVTRLKKRLLPAQENKIGSKYSGLSSQDKKNQPLSNINGNNSYSNNKYSSQKSKQEEDDVFNYAWKNKNNTQSTTSNNTKKQEPKDNYDFDYGAEDSNDFDYDNCDLNKLTNDELKKHKDKMNLTFQKNIKKPGDDGYEYEVNEEFDDEGAEDCDWDEEDIV